MTTKITEQNISNLANFGVQWQSVITADGSTATTAVAGQGYFIDTTSATHTINLPANATSGDTIAIKDYAGTFGTNALTIGRNGNNIQGVANDSEISTNRASVVLVYIDSTKGWLYTNESNVADLEAPTYIIATGGTVSTSGNDKIHSFTGDGCFVVSCVASCAPNNEISYLVVAGGGGGASTLGNGQGGGGAGGFRENKSPINPYTASPLDGSSPITVTATTYPVTVGGGGAGGSAPGNNSGSAGSNSVFSTITSAGGGYGANEASGGNGGSGGGGGSNPPGPQTGGSGNTPPVSPPQGNNGGSGFNAGIAGGGGGGGALGGGSNTPPSGQPGGDGGLGATTGISGSSTGYAGGGGAGSSYGTPDSGGSATEGGGAGGGGPQPTNSGGGTPGTANTGGGGGSNGISPSGGGGAGGKGIVIIRYKYQ